MKSFTDTENKQYAVAALAFSRMCLNVTMMLAAPDYHRLQACEMLTMNIPSNIGQLKYRFSMPTLNQIKLQSLAAGPARR